MKHILLVDDSPSILMSMAGILSVAQYGATQARSGIEALRCLGGAQKMDLMITDLHMPEMDGITLIRQARKLLAYRFVPFLVLTTESQQAVRIEAKAAGATGWLVKPVKTPDLLGVLQKLLGGK
jgi:two-component system chemotaxis response regulator CheY